MKENLKLFREELERFVPPAGISSFSFSSFVFSSVPRL